MVAVKEETIERLKTLKSEVTEEEQYAGIVADIKRIRMEYGLSQYDFEKITGINQSVIARTESGTTMPNMRTILSLLRALGKTLCVCELNCDENCSQTAGGVPPTGTDECAGAAAADTVAAVAQTDDPAGSIQENGEKECR